MLSEWNDDVGSMLVVHPGLPSVTEFQHFVTEITLLLLKFWPKYWNVLISQLFPHKNTEICIELWEKLELLQFVIEVNFQRLAALYITYI